MKRKETVSKIIDGDTIETSTRKKPVMSGDQTFG